MYLFSRMFGNYYLTNFPWSSPLIIVPLIAWSLFWKGKALWKAAKNTHKYWFIFFLLVNTVGILEILYIYFFSKKTHVATAAVKVKPLARKKL